MTPTDPDLSRATWRKSTHSGQGNCIEVADSAPHAVAVRDSADPGGPALAFTTCQWTVFTSTLKG